MSKLIKKEVKETTYNLELTETEVRMIYLSLGNMSIDDYEKSSAIHGINIPKGKEVHEKGLFLYEFFFQIMQEKGEKHDK